MSDLEKQQQVNDKIDSLSIKIQDFLKKIVNAIPFFNPLKFLLSQQTLKEAIAQAPDKSNNWVKLGLSKTWWAFIAIGAVIIAGIAKFGIDALYRIAMFLIDSWVAFFFVFVGILLLRMLGIWDAVLGKIINFLNGFKK